MAIFTLKDLYTNIGSTVRETQINTLLTDFINLTAEEIHNYHFWSWLRRKQTFSTVASQEDYNLDEEVERIAFIRQITSPQKLIFVPDRLFYRIVPNPEDQATGDPRFYREWEETGFSAPLAAADTIYVVSSSASDTSAFKVVVTGRNSSGEVVTESFSLNGTTNVTSTNTFAANGLMRVSKSATTTGTISVYRTTGATLLSEIAPLEITPRFKRISLYPIPSSAITMYLEYYERFRPLLNDNDVPAIPYHWHWVLREGTLTKAWSYKQNREESAASQANFEKGLFQMRQQDEQLTDYVPVLERRVYRPYQGVVRLSDSISDNLPKDALVF